VELPQTEQFVEIFHLIANAQLVIAIFDVGEHKVHELAEDLLGGDSVREAVAHEGHHDIECELIFDLKFELLSFDFEQDCLLAEDLKQNPARCNDGDEYDEVHYIVVGLIVEGLADYTDKEDQAHSKVLRLDKNVYLFYIIRSKEDSVGGLKSLEHKEEDNLDQRVLAVDIECIA
jgi:hypothetical protein